MTKTLALVFVSLSLALNAVGSASAQDAVSPDTIIRSGEDIELDQFIWTHRPLVIFADSPADPRFIQQMDFLTDGVADLAERDMIVLTDTDPETTSALRKKLRPRGFVLVLIAKDGTILLRKPAPWDVREITRVVDKQPSRQQEVRDRRQQAN